MGILPSFPEPVPGLFLDRKGRPCPDPAAIRERYAVHGCATFGEPLDLTESLSRLSAVLIVDEGGDLSIILNSAESEGGRLAALAYLHQTLVDPTNPIVPWDESGTGGWLLPFQWRLSAEKRGEAVDQALGRHRGAAQAGSKCLASTQAGHRCTRDAGWAGGGFCWQHWQLREPDTAALGVGR